MFLIFSFFTTIIYAIDNFNDSFDKLDKISKEISQAALSAEQKALLRAQEGYDLNDVYEDEKSKVWREKDTKKIANGIVHGVMENGLSYEFTLKNGKKEGIEKMDSNFGPFSRCNYIHGLKQGLELFYSISSANYLIGKNNYINGLQEGKAYWYNHKNGKLSYIENYKHDKKDGLQKYFYDSGNLYEIIRYDNGVKLSETDYYQSGEKLINAKFLKSNEIIGKTFYKNGNIKSQFHQYSRDSGKIITYDKNHHKKYEIIMKNEDDFIGYIFNKNKKIKMNYAQTYNYLKSKEWLKGEE